MYYIGTVVLKMSEEAFWKTTPRKLNALCRVYIEANSLESKGGRAGAKPKQVYIDQVVF